MKIVLAIAALMLIAGFGQASTLKVCPTGCDYTSIQSAVYAAHPNDTIEVDSGTYNESVILTKNIKFQGIDTGSGEPVVNGGLYKNNFDSSLRGFSFLDITSSLAWSYKMANQNTTVYWVENASEIASKSSIKGLALINKVLKTNPKDAWSWYRKGQILYNAQRYEESMDAFNESAKLDPYDYNTWDYIGLNYYFMKKYEESIQDFDHFIQLNPNSASIWANKGNSFYYLSKYDEAIKAYNQAIQLDPNTGVYWYDKGNALKALGQTTDADAAFAKAKKLGFTG